MRPLHVLVIIPRHFCEVPTHVENLRTQTTGVCASPVFGARANLNIYFRFHPCFCLQKTSPSSMNNLFSHCYISLLIPKVKQATKH